MHRKLSDVSVGRENNIDFLRFLLAGLVIFSHSYPLMWGSNEREPVSLATGGQRTAGELAVDGFFILSGFLIARSWVSSRGLGDYLRRRVLRIYPGYLAAIAFSSLVAAPLLMDRPAAYWAEFSWREFVVQGLNLGCYYAPGGPEVNGSLWSIRYEFLCYLAVAAWGLCGILSRRYLLVLGWLACLGLHAGQIYYHLEMYGSRLSWLYGYPGFWPRLMGDFLAGVLFYSFRDRIVLARPLLFASLLGLFVFGVARPLTVADVGAGRAVPRRGGPQLRSTVPAGRTVAAGPGTISIASSGRASGGRDDFLRRRNGLSTKRQLKAANNVVTDPASSVTVSGWSRGRNAWISSTWSGNA
jgi:peptidoglycan/LPS O-acetylase OafA/YrhL